MRTAHSLLVASVLFFSLAAAGQITFQRKFTITGNDEGWGVRQRWNGGYVAAATLDYECGYLLATDSIGNVDWELSTDWFAGVSTLDDVEVTLAGAWAYSGLFMDSLGAQVFLGSVSDAGDTLWTKRIWTGRDTRIYRLCVTHDGGYAVAGCRDTNFNYLGGYILRTDSLGDTLWTRFYFDVDWPNAVLIDVMETGDDGFAASGYAMGVDDRAWVVRTDSLGDTLWTRLPEWGPPVELIPVAMAIVAAPDGGFLIAGSPRCNAARLDSMGNTIWDTSYATAGSFAGIAVCESGYLLVGSTGVGTGTDGFMLRIGEAGDTIWSRRYGLSGVSDVFMGVALTNDGGFILTGTADGDPFPWQGRLWLLKTDSLGLIDSVPPVIESTTVWTDTTFVGPFPVSAIITDNQMLDSTRLVYQMFPPQPDTISVPPDSVVGDRHYFTLPSIVPYDSIYFVYQVGAWDICMNETLDTVHEFWTYNVTSVPDAPSVPTEFALHAPAPNPFNPTTRISFSLPEAAHVRLDVFDLLGRKAATLLDEPRQAGEHAVEWDAGGFASGVYLIRLRADSRVATARLVLLK